MTAIRFADDVNAVLIIASFLAAAGFIGAVSAYWPWWRSHVGRSFVLVDAALALALLGEAIRRLAGSDSAAVGWVWLDTALRLLTIPAIVYCGAVLWRIQRRGVSEIRRDMAASSPREKERAALGETARAGDEKERADAVGSEPDQDGGERVR